MKRNKWIAVVLCVSMLFTMSACTQTVIEDTNEETTSASETTTTVKGQPVQITVATQAADSTKPIGGNNQTPVVTEEFGVLKNDSDFEVQMFYTPEALQLASQLQYVNFLDEKNLTVSSATATVSTIRVPDTDFAFLHESAIIEYKGTLFAAWYSCKEDELAGYTPIHGSRSTDGGKTWSKMEVWAHDPSGEEMYCPPVFGISDGKLYMLVNTMKGFDNITALELYCWNAQTSKFDKVWRKSMCFKINTNVVTLPNGKLLIPGRSGTMGKNPLNPAVLISDNGKIDGNWRIVTVDPVERIAPETTVMAVGKTLYMFSRSDKPELSFVYVSTDNGETWSKPATHDFPLRAVKIYAGTFSDGRNYIIGNVDVAGRTRVAMYISEKNSCQFTKRIVLYDAAKPAVANTEMAHYPCVYESGGKIYITLTVGYKKSSNIVPVTNHNTGRYSWFVRGLNLFVLNLSDL